ncbi:MAG: HNH endonuclease [Paraburkholderia sp.]|uniref:HNH endonuclease n=1 Tax=Paraburkholderia sp. TaxID=1926495 RepID=UPI003C3CC63F
MANNKLSLQEKLLSKTVKVGDCLIWTGMKSDKGYGRIKTGGKVRAAHIVHYELHHGPVPDGKVLMHSCDTPACIHLGHLSPGTQLENVQDMFSKGRANKCKGESHPKAKLTDDQVAEIRRRYVPGVRGNGSHVLAKEFGVSKTAVRAILSGKSRSA